MLTSQPDPTDLNPRRWAILAVLVTSLLVVVLDNTVLNVALPTIQEELGASQEELVWAINSYTCVFAALLFTWGVLGDRYGRKRILIIGLLSFGLASLVTAYATSPLQLIVFRGLLGAAGASVLPVTLAIITVVFPPHERGKAIGLWAAAVGGAVAVGPVLGGLLVEHFWWGSVFLINVPIVIVGVIAIWLLVPESKNPQPGRLDPLGVVLSVSGLLLLTYGILHGGDTGSWGSPAVLGPLLGGLALVAVFVWIEWRSDHPSLDLSLFQIRSFSVPLAAVSLAFAAMSGTLIFLTFYLQIVRDFSALQAGMCLLPVAAGQLLAAPRSGRTVAAFGARRVIGVGLLIVTLDFVGIAFLTTSTPVWIVLVLFFFLGFGLGNVIAPCTTRMTLATPPARSGAGSAVQNTLRQVGGALGIAVISSVVAMIYSDRIAPALSTLPPDVAGTAEDSVGATYEVAKQIGGNAADALRTAGAEAFLGSLRWGALISAALAALALVLIVWRLPAKAEAVDWAGGLGGAGHAPGPGSHTDHDEPADLAASASEHE